MKCGRCSAVAPLHTQVCVLCRMFAWAAAPGVLLGGALSVWGPEGGALLVGQAVLSVLMLEAANYVQHYGLQRTKLENGR